MNYILYNKIKLKLRKKMRRRNFRFIIKFLILLIVIVILTIFTYKAMHLLRDIIDGGGGGGGYDGGDTRKNKDIVDHGAEERQEFQKEIERHFNEKRMDNDDDISEEKILVKEAEEEEELKMVSTTMMVGHQTHGKLIDWHDWEFIAYEKTRTGLGEQGEAGTLPAELSVLRQEMYDHNGFNALLSDKISLNRSLPDIRHKDCVHLKYLSKLPTVSVVVPFYNEHFSALLRTCYSVLNRSPPHLIHEIILVDDCSNRENLKQQLDDYIREHLPKVKVVRLDRRSGLITARLAGAKAATGHVLLFLDSHTEPNVNWLPPLLDPIAKNYRVCVCPLIDVIAHESFKYTAQDEGQRGGFDWQFFYKRFPKLPEDLKHPTKPFKSPVMAGGLFAISTKFFWELGGYDEGLDIWGGEQYELSFKIWQCGGEMYDVPCSRVGHIYRGPQIKSNENPRNFDFVHKNYKRVAEVWMDEYKNYIYARDRDIYANIDAGDLTKQMAIREKLQCKPFKWFMEEVAFDLAILYPPIEPLDIAYGAIQSLAHPRLCLDTLNHPQNQPVGLYSCADNLENPQHNQYFFITWRKDIRNKYKSLCFDVSAGGPNAEIILYECHGQKGNQEWHYNQEKQWLIQGTIDSRGRCMDLNGETMKVFVNPCDETNENMRWKFGFYNESSSTE